jgi:hypothetical protein
METENSLPGKSNKSDEREPHNPLEMCNSLTRIPFPFYEQTDLLKFQPRKVLPFPVKFLWFHRIEFDYFELDLPFIILCDVPSYILQTKKTSCHPLKPFQINLYLNSLSQFGNTEKNPFETVGG